jgi:hypothetical protein
LKGGRCEDLRAGDVYTLISAPDRIGTFAGLRDGQSVRLRSHCGSHVNAALTDATARIAYTPTGVTATVMRGGHAGDIPQSVGRVHIAGDAVVGHTLTAESRWSGKPRSFRYMWMLCTRSGASCAQRRGHSAHLKLTRSMVHRIVSVTVIAKNRYGSDQNFGQLRHGIRPPTKH